MFALCPENSMYPGYYTEKVPESFSAGCIPITWADQNIRSEFNPASYINLVDYASVGYRNGLMQVLQHENLKKLVREPLLLGLPDFRGLLRFLERVVKRALL